jgi:hypothetical protein
MDIPGLPKSRDPYEPAKRDFEKPILGPRADIPEDEEELDLGELGDEDEVGEPTPNRGEIPGLGKEEDIGADIDPSELNPDDVGELGPEVPDEPPKPHWGPVSLPNKKDIGFQRSDGFILRMRKLESVPGRWLAQLYRDDEVVSGRGPKFLNVPAGEDPYKYAQKTADLSLDAFSKRYDQQMSPASADRGLYAGAPGVSVPPQPMSFKPPDLAKKVSPPTFTEPSAPARGGGSKGLDLGSPSGVGGGGNTETGKEPKAGEEPEPGKEKEEEEELDIGDLELA